MGGDPTGLDTVTLNEITVEGRTPDQVARDIRSQTGMRAYDAASALGIKPGGSPTWISETEAGLERLGAMKPAEGPPPSVETPKTRGPSFDSGTQQPMSCTTWS